jgi:transposase InsO family protein
MQRLSRHYPRYGARRIRVFLGREGIEIGKEKCGRLWAEQGLQVPKKRPRPRRRVAASRPRPLAPSTANSVWSDDFVFDACANGQQIKCLTVVDEYTREALAIDVAGAIRSGRVIEVLSQLISVRGAPRYLRSDNVLNARGFAEKGKSILAKRKSPFGSAKRASTTIQCSSTSRVSLPDHSGHKIRSLQRHDLHRT